MRQGIPAGKRSIPPHPLPSPSYFQDNNLLALDFYHPHDLSTLSDDDYRMLSFSILRSQNLNQPTASSLTQQVRAFVHEIEIGDLVLVPDRTGAKPALPPLRR